MKQVEKLKADRRRQAEALDRAVEQTTLIKSEEKAEFPTLDAKAAYGEWRGAPCVSIAERAADECFSAPPHTTMQCISCMRIGPPRVTRGA